MNVKTWVAIFWLILGATTVAAIERRFGFTWTGLICVVLALLVVAVLAIKASLNVPALRKAALHSFSRERASISPELGNGTIATVFIFILGFALGLLVYVDRTNAYYRELSSAYCRADVLSDVFATENAGNWPSLEDEFRTGSDPCGVQKHPAASRIDLKQVYRVLRHFNLLDPDDPSEDGFVAGSQSLNSNDKPGNSTNRNAKIASIMGSDGFKFSPGEPTIDLVLALASGLNGSTQHPCLEVSDVLQRTALASALAQQPYPAMLFHRSQFRSLRSKPTFAIFAREPVGRVMQRLKQPGVADVEINEGCPTYLQTKTSDIASHLSRWSSLTFIRPEPELTSQEIAGLALKWDLPISPNRAANSITELQNDAVMRFMAVLLSEMRGTEVVRGKRRWVNALVGYERCAVICLAAAFIIFLFVRFIQRLPQEIHRSEIEEAMKKFRNDWRTGDGGRADASRRWTDAEELRKQLANGNLGGEPVRREAKRQITTIPLRILGAALDEMKLSGHAKRASQANGEASKVESTFVETVSDGERRKLESSRLVFDTLLPTFPAIGFVGTVSSLLVAMSEADRIVRTDEALARGVAASQVTDILSLCFSTTLLALLCVLVFSPLSLMQASRERSLIDDTEYQVQTVLRPEQP